MEEKGYLLNSNKLKMGGLLFSDNQEVKMDSSDEDFLPDPGRPRHSISSEPEKRKKKPPDRKRPAEEDSNKGKCFLFLCECVSSLLNVNHKMNQSHQHQEKQEWIQQRDPGRSQIVPRRKKKSRSKNEDSSMPKEKRR